MAKKAAVKSKVQEILETYRIHTVPVDVESLALLLGATIKKQDFDDALAGFVYHKVKLIGVNAKDSPRRQRFTIAHELGHMYLHSREDSLIYDRDFSIHRRDDRASTGIDSQEIEANQFAAELLMPENLLLKDIEHVGGRIDPEDDTTIEKLADKYEVSRSAMSVRLMSLGYI
jgi:Zn-dependent peptidase ImmA (M78 family)